MLSTGIIEGPSGKGGHVPFEILITELLVLAMWTIIVYE